MVALCEDDIADSDMNRSPKVKLWLTALLFSHASASCFLFSYSALKGSEYSAGIYKARYRPLNKFIRMKCHMRNCV